MILLYHLVFPDSTPKNTWNAGKVMRISDFKKHLMWLKKSFNILSLENYLREKSLSTDASQSNLAITFDDGYRQTFDLVKPILFENQAPATFFITTSHLQDGELLWFVYFNALCFEKTTSSIEINRKNYPLHTEKACYHAWQTLIKLARASGDAVAFTKDYAKYHPLPESTIHKYLGLTAEQIASCADTDLLTLGGHTHNHPYLDQISKSDQLDQMSENKRLLESISGQPIWYFAYTGGVYNANSIAAAKSAGFTAACAIQPRNIGKDERFELPRTDIYAPSLFLLKLKMLGWVERVRNFINR